MFRDVTSARFKTIHDEAFQDDSFIETSIAVNGSDAGPARWAQLSLPGASVLEIGPGAGHLLAAAQKDGRQVTAVESSEVHRNFIREALGISEVYGDIGELPDDRSFDSVVAINVLEHVYDIGSFLRSVHGILAPGGTFFASMPNASSLEAHVLKTWWSMCKEHDHVSFPSPRGMAAGARASGLRVERIWSGGLPFEFPVSVLTAARDRIGARRTTVGVGGATEQDPAALARAGTFSNSTKAKLGRFYSAAAPFDPTARLLTALGCASTLKARLIR